MSDSSETAAILGRRTGAIDLAAVSDFYRGRAALVTGAGGRIGAALCRTLVKAGCRRVTGLDSDEHALVDLLGVDHLSKNDRFDEVLCNVRDRARLESAFAQRQPDVVVHAAALKNVAFCDRHAAECVLTNVVGVRNAADAAAQSGASTMVHISSDKAAAPSSLAGACMRLAEMHLNWRDRQSGDRDGATRFATVRLGNVFGSRGSVIGAFRRQIARGGPVILSDRAMRRYFMTAEEAVGLIVRVGAAEATAGGTFLLDVGQPVLIRDVAARMVARSGRDIAIVVGTANDLEKREEDLFDEFERATHAGVEGVLRIDSLAADPVTDDDIDALEALARDGDEDEVRAAVFSMLARRLGRDMSAPGAVAGPRIAPSAQATP